MQKIAGCQTVVHKASIIANQYRVFDMEVLAGKSDFITKLVDSRSSRAVSFQVE